MIGQTLYQNSYRPDTIKDSIVDQQSGMRDMSNTGRYMMNRPNTHVSLRNNSVTFRIFGLLCYSGDDIIINNIPIFKKFKECLMYIDPEDPDTTPSALYFNDDNNGFDAYPTEHFYYRYAIPDGIYRLPLESIRIQNIKERCKHKSMLAAMIADMEDF